VRPERLGIVSYANVAPLHWKLRPWPSAGGEAEFVRGVPTELNTALLAGEIDLTLVSSIEFVRHRHLLKALPDFSIATLGPVYSVMLFHRPTWSELGGARVAVSVESATSVELLRQLLEADGMAAELIPARGSLDEMLAAADAALLIGDAALKEGVAHAGTSRIHVTDLGDAWYRLNRLPFTFAVWASRDDRPPSAALVESFRAARRCGLGELALVAAAEAGRLGLPQAVVQRYLENFRYYLEVPDRDGLLAFARASDPAFQERELRFWEV